MANMYVTKDKFRILNGSKEPKINDTLEDMANVYTVKRVRELHIPQLNLKSRLFMLDVDVWNKFEYQGDEPESLIFLQDTELDEEKLKEEILKNDIAVLESDLF